MDKKGKHITELEVIIKEYEETLSNKEKDIAELEEQLETETKIVPSIDNVSLIHFLMIKKYVDLIITPLYHHRRIFPPSTNITSLPTAFINNQQ